MKTAKTLGDLIDQKIADKNEHDTFAKETLVCPHCGCEHDPDAFRKQTQGTIKCLDCGEAFQFESTTRTYYSTYI